MTKVKFKFKGLGYNNYYQADVSVYNDNNLIYQDRTYDSELLLYLKKYHVYKIIASFLGETITYYVYINTDKYCFSLNSNLISINNNPITFILTDYHYDNLPIERGEIILWPRM